MIIEEDVDDFNILEKYNLTILDGVNKWNLRLSDWPYLDDSNYLRLCVKLWIQGDAGETNITTYLENDLNDGYKIYHFHNHMNMFVPEYYKCGLKQEIKTVDIDITDYSMNDMMLCFNFEYCQDLTGDHSHIEYDPFIYFGSMLKEHQQQDIDPFDPFIYTSSQYDDPCIDREFVVEETDDEWKFDLYSMLIGLGIGLFVAICVGIIVARMNKNKVDDQDETESKNNKKGNKTSRQQQRKEKKRGFFTKVSSGDVDDD